VPEEVGILAALLVMGVGVIFLAKLASNILNLLALTTVLLEILDITMVELCAQAVGGHVAILPKIAILTIFVVMSMLVEDTIMSAVGQVVPLAVLAVLPRDVLM
jgi:hypothetical protein